MADIIRLRLTITSSHLGFRLPFLPIFAGLPINPSTFWAINSTENNHPIDLDIDGNKPLEKTLNCLNLVFRLTFICIYAGWWAQGNPITTYVLCVS